MKIDKKYKWLARDKNGQLWAYEKKPEKSDEIWEEHLGIETFIGETDDTYSFIKWELKEPTSIEYVKNKVGTIDLRHFGLTLDEMISETEDNINKPSHYHSNGTDVISFAKAQFSTEEQKGFHRINAIKYITRYDRKNGIEDLNKAKFYIDKLIELEDSKPLE